VASICGTRGLAADTYGLDDSRARRKSVEPRQLRHLPAEQRYDLVEDVFHLGVAVPVEGVLAALGDDVDLLHHGGDGRGELAEGDREGWGDRRRDDRGRAR
jgi:hypothetical protein